MDSLSALADYASRTRVPICVSETLGGKWEFRDLLETGACGIVMPDVSWCGGLTEARKIAALAGHLAPGRWPPHDCSGPVAFMACVHLSLSVPNALVQESVRSFYTGWYRELVTAVPVIENGWILPPEGPGLGTELLPDLERAQGRPRDRQPARSGRVPPNPSRPDLLSRREIEPRAAPVRPA